MKKRILALLLLILMLTTLAPAAMAAPGDRDVNYATDIANELKALGLFKGISDTEYDLGRAPNRVEGLTMLVRLKGEEAQAIAASYSHPFPDVPEWADDIVGWAYHKGYTNGISNTPGNYLFDSYSKINADQYITFVLRALGYSDTGADADFVWNNPYPLANELGLITRFVDTENFLRADVVFVSWQALKAVPKNENHPGYSRSLADVMIERGIFDWPQWETAMLNVEFSPYDHDMHDNVAVGTFVCYEDLSNDYVYDPRYRPTFTLYDDNTLQIYSNMGEGMYYSTGHWWTETSNYGKTILHLDISPCSTWYAFNHIRLEVVDAGGLQLKLLDNLHVTGYTSYFIHDLLS